LKIEAQSYKKNAIGKMNHDTLNRLFSFLEQDPEDAFTLYSIAYEYAKNDQHLSAIKYFLKLRKNHPQYIGLYYHLGKSYEKEKKQEEAEKIYQEGILMARQQRDRHALSELQNALNELMEDD
jgi:predicted Zn-dependent protease